MLALPRGTTRVRARVSRHDLRDLVLSWTHVSHAVTKSMIHDMQRWMLILSDWQRGEIRSLLQNAADKPIVVCHMSDGWSAFVESREVDTSPGAPRVVRAARTKKEFLIERGFVKHMAEGRIKTKFLVAPARPLDHGLSGWHIFASASEFLECGRLEGHRGLTFTLYVQDGLHYKGMGRHS